MACAVAHCPAMCMCMWNAKLRAKAHEAANRTQPTTDDNTRHMMMDTCEHGNEYASEVAMPDRTGNTNKTHKAAGTGQEHQQALVPKLQARAGRHPGVTRNMATQQLAPTRAVSSASACWRRAALQMSHSAFAAAIY
jgi:hypothetical protein